MSCQNAVDIIKMRNDPQNLNGTPSNELYMCAIVDYEPRVTGLAQYDPIKIHGIPSVVVFIICYSESDRKCQ